MDMKHIKPGFGFKYEMLALVACVLWGSAFAGAKIGFVYAGPITLSGIRFTLAGLLLLPVLLAIRVDIKGALRHWRFMLGFGLMQTYLQYGLFFMGLDKVPGAVAAIITGMGPLFVALMAHFTMPGDRFTVRKSVAVALGLAGVVFLSVSKGGTAQAGSSFYAGILLLLCSNITGSYTNIMVAKSDNKIHPVMLTSFANFTGGVLLFLTALVAERPDFSAGYPLRFWGAVLWLAIIPAAGFSIWYYLLSRPGIKVSELNIRKFVVPVVGVVMSWALLPGESPNLQTVAGIAITVVAVAIMQWPVRERRCDEK